MYPAATADDQEGIMEGKQEPTVLSTPSFSSPNPETDALKMLPVEDGTSAHVASLEAHALRAAGNAAEMKAGDFKDQVEAATTQEELDTVANLYAESGKDFSTVEAAIEKKQSEINDQ
jgi:hypothetical protein